MGTKKDIAQALKEQLDNLTASPDTMVWKLLETKLKAKKRKKRILQFWFNFTTAGLILLLIIFLNKDSISTFLNIENKNVETIDSNSELDKPQINQKGPLKWIESTKDTIQNASSKEVYPIYNDSLLENTPNSSAFTNNNSEMEKPNNKSNIHNRQDLKKHKAKYVQKTDNKGGINNDSNSNKIFKLQDNTASTNMLSDTLLSNRKNLKIDNHRLSRNTEMEEKLKDSINEVVKESPKKNTAELEDKEEQRDSLKNVSPGKWGVFPNVSMVYYDGFQTSFSEQSTFNYGVYLTYLPHNDLSFRIGFNSLNLTQTSQPLPNRILQQEVRYLEIPLELKFIIINRKLQTSVIAGTSYLLLQDARAITLEDSFSNTSNNTSDFFKSTLSINLGLQFQTKIYKKFYFNLEPMFKYHYKPYSAAQDFNPFIISITGGVEYKF